VPTARFVALLALALPWAAGCRSSAPYTMPAAALNTGLAVGAALGQRSAGGCYASCAPGTRCNPATGYCDSTVDVCVGPDSTSPGCFKSGRGGAATLVDQPKPGAEPATGLGISPATGRPPTMPAEKPGPEGR